jgi:deaminated glutathione amidase
MLPIGLVQTCSGIDPAANADGLLRAATQLADEGATIIFTPEMSGLLDRDTARMKASAKGESSDPSLAALRQLAADKGVAIVIGSLAIATGDGRIANRCFVIDRTGHIAARYDKLHLFDVDLPNGDRYRESATFAPGSAVQLVQFDWGILGLAICYDVRFPALFAALAGGGASLISVPAAFTVPTGEAHWHTLLRARAIESGAFVVAAAQSGKHADGRETFGHSLVVDPWGRVLLDMGTDAGTARIDLDLGMVAETRARIPNLRHGRPLPQPQHATASA